MPVEDDPVRPLADLTVGSTGSVSPLIAAIDETVDAQRDREQQLRREFGTNNTDFRALLLVFRMSRRGLPVHPGDLTRGLGLSSGTGAQVISRLTAAGLLIRLPDPYDARAGLLALTAQATHRLALSTQSIRHDLDAIISALSPAEEAHIITLLEQVQTVFRSQRATRGKPA